MRDEMLLGAAPIYAIAFAGDSRAGASRKKSSTSAVSSASDSALFTAMRKLRAAFEPLRVPRAERAQLVDHPAIVSRRAEQGV